MRRMRENENNEQILAKTNPYGHARHLLSLPADVYNPAKIIRQGVSMDRLFEFVVNHYVLVSAFVVLLIATIVLESRRGGQKLGAQEAVGLINRDQAVVLDIREKKDAKEGRITGSIHIPLSSLKDRINELEPHKNTRIIVVDKMGQHGSMAVKQLNEAGFTDVVRLNGGIGEWRASNLPLVKK